MRIDYHMHFENGSYTLAWAKGFFESAQLRSIDEIGFAEHTHGFIEFKDLYYRELVLDESPVGQFQQTWLASNKFKYSLQDYFAFMRELKQQGYVAKIGIEVCNFHDHAAVQAILRDYPFDYIIGSVHFLNGWGYDAAALQKVWSDYCLQDIYEWYVAEVERLCASGLVDILGHPFNIRLFKHFPDFDVSPYLERVACALKKSGMAIDINTGTRYRYPVQEISPYPDFMRVAKQYDLPIVLSSDAHKPEDCGRYIDEAKAYAESFGYNSVLVFERRQAKSVPLT